MNIATETLPGTALTAPVPTDLQALFKQPDGIKAELARIKAEAAEKSKGLDAAKPKDREAIKSVAFRVVKYKTAMDAAGKELNEDRRKIIDAVDAERRLVRDTLDRLAEEIRAPALKAEAEEAARVAAIRARLEASFGPSPLPPSSGDLIAIRGVVAAVPLDASWSEFLDRAEAAQVLRLNVIDRAIEVAIEREERDAELNRLRAEAAAQAEADRAARELALAEAAERQRLADAQAEQARAAQEAAEAAQRKAEQEAADLRQQLADAEAKAARDRQQAEIDAIERARKADEAAAQAKRDEDARVASEAAAIEQAKRDEADRIAAEAVAAEFQAAMAAKLAEDRTAIRAAIIAALTAMSGRATPEAIADALINGDIPHCKVVL